MRFFGRAVFLPELLGFLAGALLGLLAGLAAGREAGFLAGFDEPPLLIVTPFFRSVPRVETVGVVDLRFFLGGVAGLALVIGRDVLAGMVLTNPPNVGTRSSTR